MTTPDGCTGPGQEPPVPDAGRAQRDVPETTTAAGPGLTVSRERLADGRRITYYGLSR